MNTSPYRRVWARKGPFSCPSVAMSVRTDRMFAIPFAINLGSVAVILRRCEFASCNHRAHDPPMFAIPTADVCRSLHAYDQRPAATAGGHRAADPEGFAMPDHEHDIATYLTLDGHVFLAPQYNVAYDRDLNDGGATPP